MFFIMIKNTGYEDTHFNECLHTPLFIMFYY